MSRLKVKPPFRVQVIVQENMEYFRETVLGARHHGFSNGRLMFVDRWLDHELAGDLAKLVKRDGVQGIISAIHTPALERRFASLGIPVVNVSNSISRSRLAVVTQDDVAVGAGVGAARAGGGEPSFGGGVAQLSAGFCQVESGHGF